MFVLVPDGREEGAGGGDGDADQEGVRGRRPARAAIWMPTGAATMAVAVLLSTAERIIVTRHQEEKRDPGGLPGGERV